jgi:hypothetical protein
MTGEPNLNSRSRLRIRAAIKRTVMDARLTKLETKRMMHGETICLWCAAPVTLRRGGSPKKFCSARCRHEFHSCARRWAEAAVAAGALSIDVLKNGGFAACTLLPGATLASAGRW